MKKLNYLILLFLVSAFSFANVSPKEKEALIALYNSTNGKDWNSAWDINASENTWYGVKIENNQIVELSLQFNNLDGNLPQEIGDLVNLRKINLGFNKLKGKLPTSISNLKELISLELFMNSFEGNIPTELGELKKLENKEVKIDELASTVARANQLVEYCQSKLQQTEAEIQKIVKKG